MRKLHRSRELQLTSVIGTRPLMGSIHASRIARTRAARSHCGGRSVGRWVGRSSDSSTPLRFASLFIVGENGVMGDEKLGKFAVT